MSVIFQLPIHLSGLILTLLDYNVNNIVVYLSVILNVLPNPPELILSSYDIGVFLKDILVGVFSYFICS